MFKAIGVVTFIAVAALSIAHYTGHLKLNGNVDVTDKGHTLIEEGIDGAQDLTNKGFDALRSKKAKTNPGM